MKPTREPMERVWFDEQPIKDHPALRILAAGLAVGLAIIVVGYRWDGTW